MKPKAGQSNGDGPFSYMLGGYYEREHFNPSTLNNMGLSALGTGLPPYTATTFIGQYGSSDQRTRTLSGFGSIGYDLSDRLKIAGGLRYSSVRKQATRSLRYGVFGNTVAGLAPVMPTPENFVPGTPEAQAILATRAGRLNTPYPFPRRTDDEFMPAANIRYEFTPDAMVYASYAHGFKAGGFSSNTADAFDPETVDSYEVGLKAQWWNRRITTNISLFRAKYKNLQEAALVPNAGGTLTSVVTNAGSTVSQGVEFSGSIRLGGFTLRPEISYVDAHYLSYPNAACAPPDIATGKCPAGFRDLGGRRRVYSPKWSGNIAADYRFPVNQDLSMRFGGTVFFTSSFYRDPTIHELVLQEGFAKLDLRAAIGPDDGRWEAAVIARNVTDKLTASYGTYAIGAQTSTITQPDPPRSVAFQVSVKF